MSKLTISLLAVLAISISFNSYAENNEGDQKSISKFDLIESAGGKVDKETGEILSPATLWNLYTHDFGRGCGYTGQWPTRYNYRTEQLCREAGREIFRGTQEAWCCKAQR